MDERGYTGVELLGHNARTKRLEDAKKADEEEKRFKGRAEFAPGFAAPVPPDLASALRELVFHALPCASCRHRAGGRPATRRVLGTVESRAGRQTAEVSICDDCEPPASGAFYAYRWGLAFDLPHAGALRVVLKHLPPIVLPEEDP